jgi:hypothetical protein
MCGINAIASEVNQSFQFAGACQAVQADIASATQNGGNTSLYITAYQALASFTNTYQYSLFSASPACNSIITAATNAANAILTCPLQLQSPDPLNTTPVTIINTTTGKPATIGDLITGTASYSWKVSLTKDGDMVSTPWLDVGNSSTIAGIGVSLTNTASPWTGDVSTISGTADPADASMLEDVCEPDVSSISSTLSAFANQSV